MDIDHEGGGRHQTHSQDFTNEYLVPNKLKWRPGHPFKKCS